MHELVSTLKTNDDFYKHPPSFSGLESLHKAVNPDILPREYGGKTYSVEECIGLWREELEHNRSTLLQLDQLKVAGVRCSLFS